MKYFSHFSALQLIQKWFQSRTLTGLVRGGHCQSLLPIWRISNFCSLKVARRNRFVLVKGSLNINQNGYITSLFDLVCLILKSRTLSVLPPSTMSRRNMQSPMMVKKSILTLKQTVISRNFVAFCIMGLLKVNPL